jgi:hypothetical protein
MIRHRTKKQVNLFDLFKLVVTIILLLLLIDFWRSGAGGPPLAATEPATTEQTTAADTAPAESETEPTVAEAETTEPALPTLNLPAGELETGELELTGTGEPGSEVEIVVDGEAIGMTTVGSDGTWRFAANLPEAGDYRLGVRSLGTDGSVLAEIEPVALSLAAPTIAMPTFNLPDGELQAGEIELTGTGEPGSEVEIVVDGEAIGTTTVGSDGTWRFAANLPEAGDYRLGVRSLGTDGSVLTEIEPVALSLAAPTMTMPTFNLPEGELQAGEVELTGTGEPGSKVEIVVDGEAIGTTTVGSDGAWSLMANLPEVGDYQLGLRSLGLDGSVLAEIEPVAFSLAAPTMTMPTFNLPEGEFQAGEVELSGTGEPGSKVEIVINGEPIGTTTVSSDGTWSLMANLPEGGDYRLSVRTVAADGQVLAESEASTLAITTPLADAASEAEAMLEDSSSPSQADGQAYIVQADDWLSKLADKFYGDMFTYPAIVEATNAEAAQDDSFAVIDNPDLIEIGQKLWIPAKSTVINQ